MKRKYRKRTPGEQVIHEMMLELISPKDFATRIAYLVAARLIGESNPALPLAAIFQKFRASESRKLCGKAIYVLAGDPTFLKCHPWPRNRRPLADRLLTLAEGCE